MAMNKVASMYKNGEGVKKDAAKSEEWDFKWALNRAETGNSYAMFLLYNHYQNGTGTTADSEKALSWLKKSAQNGSENAMEELIKISENDSIDVILQIYNNSKEAGKAEDKEKALSWLKKIAERGNETAKKELAKISEVKSPPRRKKKESAGVVVFKPDKPAEPPKVPSYLDENSFSLSGYTHFYDSRFIEYNSVRKIFVANAYAKRKEFTGEYLNSVHNFDEFYSVGLKIFESKLSATANLSVEVIKKFRRISITPEEILRICGSEGLINVEDFLEPLKKVYAGIAEAAEQLAAYRGLERSSRSRWVGGGFGFSGAIKGAIKAGMLNLATDAARGIGDSFTDASDRRKINQLKAQALNDSNFYNGQSMLQYTEDHLEAFCFRFFNAVAPIIDLKSALSRADIRATEDILYKIANYRPYATSELVDAIFANPFEPLLYLELFKSNADSYHELERLAEYVGLKDKFNDYLALWYFNETSSLVPNDNDSLQTIQDKKDKLKAFRTDLNYDVFKRCKKFVMDKLDAAEKDKRAQADKKDDGCFVTTAVCSTFGKPDDCYELTAFRKFRDTWLVKQPDGKNLIAEYYSIAPLIVDNINRRKDAAQIYQNIWQKYLEPCLNFIRSGDNLSCKKAYVKMVNQLKKIYAGE